MSRGFWHMMLLALAALLAATAGGCSRLGPGPLSAGDRERLVAQRQNVANELVHAQQRLDVLEAQDIDRRVDLADQQVAMLQTRLATEQSSLNDALEQRKALLREMSGATTQPADEDLGQRLKALGLLIDAEQIDCVRLGRQLSQAGVSADQMRRLAVQQDLCRRHRDELRTRLVAIESQLNGGPTAAVPEFVPTTQPE
ncbi:MAG: hypothetical protein BIFFINMI_03222 [Phycisphaerae bacterium]|nr:hypothetical protein [Phycisphaerae bacterium]